MSELNVTPGEWVAKIEKVGFQQYSFVVVKQGGHDYFVATAESGVPGNTIETETNNAHLIAASKELYAALELAREYASEEIARRQNAGMDTSLDVGYLKQIDAALAKARGESQ